MKDCNLAADHRFHQHEGHFSSLLFISTYYFLHPAHMHGILWELLLNSIFYFKTPGQFD